MKFFLQQLITHDFNLNNFSRCAKLASSKKNSPGKNSKKSQLKPLYASEDQNTRKTNSKQANSRKQKKFEDDPYVADDEDEDYNGKKRRSLETNRLVMKVVKQGDYQHKQSFDRSSGGLGDIEQDFFLPRNMTLFDSNSEVELKSGPRRNQIDYDSLESDFDDDYDSDRKSTDRARTKAVFEMPRKPLANFSKWSRWSKCSPKCVTKRFKKCRPHAVQVCGNEVIREIAYCYTEGSFCEEWISSQITKISEYNKIEAPKPTTTTRAPKTTRRTESPLTNSVWHNYEESNNGAKRRQKQNPEFKPQKFQCGFPSIRKKNTDIALKIIGGKTSRRAQVRLKIEVLWKIL